MAVSCSSSRKTTHQVKEHLCMLRLQLIESNGLERVQQLCLKP